MSRIDEIEAECAAVIAAVNALTAAIAKARKSGVTCKMRLTDDYGDEMLSVDVSVTAFVLREALK